MTVDLVPAPHAQRVMVKIPSRTEAIGEGLRDTFQVSGAMPREMARLMERLCTLS